MRTRTLIGLGAVAAAFALPAQAAHHFFHESATGEPPSDHAIHVAAASYSDQRLADSVADALRADPKLEGTTITVAADEGRIALSGSAKDGALAARAEQIAANVAGRGRVTAMIDAQGA